MRSDTQHIIQKQIIEIEFDNMDDSFGVQERVAQVYYENLQPQIGILLDEMFGKDMHASIDKLEIDCGLLNMENWEQEFTTQAILKLKEGLVQVNKMAADSKEIEETTAAETFLFYLENGFLPWNKRVESIAELESLLKVDEKLIVRLKKLIRQKGQTTKRLAYQFSEEFITKLITAFIGNSKQETESLSSVIEKVNTLENVTLLKDRIEKQLIDSSILDAFAIEDQKNRELQFFTLLLARVENNDNLKSEIKGIIEEIHFQSDRQNPETKDVYPPEYELLKSREKSSETPETGTPATLSTREQETTNKKPIIETSKPADTIYIANAGLVLLHPFLPVLFDRLKLTGEKEWKDEMSQQKAVLYLGFLTTGNVTFEEFDVMLNKILCDIDVSESVDLKIQIDDEAKPECEDLLEHVISLWKILGNTSISGLREAFLQRSGKLSRVDDGWLLQVEQKAIDVLLNQLPWGIGIIKLPWMNEKIYVDWA